MVEAVIRETPLLLKMENKGSNFMLTDLDHICTVPFGNQDGGIPNRQPPSTMVSLLVPGLSQDWRHPGKHVLPEWPVPPAWFGS